MSKVLIVLPLLLAANPKPQTIVDLKTTGCTATRICYSVGNDGLNSDGTPVVIDFISASSTYGRVTASINGVSWDSGLYAVYPMGLSFTHVDMQDAGGDHIFLSASYTHWTTLNHSGHNYYVQHWRLDSGTIEFP
jgi:hypothetical protein